MEPGLINNRELASLSWLSVVAAWLLVGHRETTLAACRDLVRATHPLAGYFVLYGIWIGVVAWQGARLGLWDPTLLKETDTRSRLCDAYT